MWKVAALIDGSWAEIQAVELPPQPFSLDVLEVAARENFPNAHLLHYLAQERESQGARDAIEIWSASAETEATEFDWASPARIVAVEEALAYYADAPGAGDPSRVILSTLAWHDHTGLIIPLTGKERSMLIEYTPSLRDENRVARLRHRYASSEHTLETILDWRGYFGRESAVIDGWKMMRRRGRGYVASMIGTAGYVVTSVLRRFKQPVPTLDRDPTAKGRLITMSERYPQIASSCPDLSTVSPKAHDRAMVFVHGTVSSGIQALKELYPALASTPADIPPPVYRYEHDTFLRLDENGVELAELISTRVPAKHLLLVAHSRGGLVARAALPELAKRGYQGDVAVYTFGTPHEGTPLVEMGGKALNLLFKLGDDIIGSIPVMTPLTKAYSYLIDSPTLPRGIEMMREESDALLLLRSHGDPSLVHAWGSEFDLEGAPSGFGVLVEGALLGAFGNRLHDLVVPTPSAVGFGMTEPLLTCSHVHYFSQPQVHAAIASFWPPATNPIVAVPTLPAGGTIEDVGDYVVVGGVRVPKRNATPQANAESVPSEGMTVSRPLELKKPAPNRYKL